MANNPASELVISDGSFDWSEGVNSDVVATIQSERNPNGLKRTQVSWMDNATVRGGGIIQRTGWTQKGTLPGTDIYQGSFMYNPLSADPYLVFVRGGHVWQVDVDNPAGAVDLSAAFGLTLPLVERVWFCQAEQFLIIQAGDGLTLPLFWDGALLRQSNGIIGVTQSAPAPVTFTRQLNAPLAVPNGPYPQTVVGVNLLDANNSDIRKTVQVVDSLNNVVGIVTITAVNAGGHKETWVFLSSPSGGITFPAQQLSLSLSSPGSFNADNNVDFIIPAVGSSVVIHTTSVWYTGNVGDNVVITTNPGGVVLGTFTVTAFTINTITVQTVSSNLIGGTVAAAATTLDFAINSPTTGSSNINEIPSATAMCYYLGRLWYAQGRQISAGDIVGGPSGTLAYNFKDSVLKVTENPLCFGGDGFTVPTSAGNIRGIAYASNLNTVLGEGQLYVGTRYEIYAITVPMSRSDWINADSKNGPTMVVALQSNGWVNDRSIVAVNGDLFFQSLEPAIRSLTTSVRNFGQWGNVPISINENRMLQFVDRSIQRFVSGIYFDNRMLQTSLPYSTPVGVAHRALAVLNFDVISTFERQLPPAWEAMWEGINFLEIMAADFGGRERAFAPVWSDESSDIQLWELTTDQRWDKDGNNRVSWYIEFPAFTWGNELQMKKLIGGELWLDKLLGEVVFNLEYRPDGDPCWYPWHSWKFCTAKDSCETVHAPVCVYPQSMRESYRQLVSFPVPPRACEGIMQRPANIGYQFQTRLSILGWCRIRGLILHAEKVERKLYDKLTC